MEHYIIYNYNLYSAFLGTQSFVFMEKHMYIKEPTRSQRKLAGVLTSGKRLPSQLSDCLLAGTVNNGAAQKKRIKLNLISSSSFCLWEETSLKCLGLYGHTCELMDSHSV